MTGFQHPTGDDDPIHLVRTIGRLAQIIQELRDEYVDGRRDDSLDQLERRMDELADLRAQLRNLRDNQHSAESPA